MTTAMYCWWYAFVLFYIPGIAMKHTFTHKAEMSGSIRYHMNSSNGVRPSLSRVSDPSGLSYAKTAAASVRGFPSRSSGVCQGARPGYCARDAARDGGQGQREATKLASERKGSATQGEKI